MSEETVTPEGESVAGGVQPTAVSTPAQSWLARVIPDHIQRIFLPEDAYEQMMPGEEMLLEIHLAWYRNFAAQFLLYYPFIVLLLTVFFSAMGYMLAVSYGFDLFWFTTAAWFGLIGFCFYALYERFNYLQWRLVKTNKRLIITMPQKDAWYLVDTIEMNNNPSVLDENWAESGMRRTFQALTGARDLYISLVGLQFDQGTSKVRDALVMPDVPHEDAERLKVLIFGNR
jgi:hypothetical protein